jgi:hypothetical protein
MRPKNTSRGNQHCGRRVVVGTMQVATFGSIIFFFTKEFKGLVRSAKYVGTLPLPLPLTNSNLSGINVGNVLAVEQPRCLRRRTRVPFAAYTTGVAIYSFRKGSDTDLYHQLHLPPHW